MSQGGEQVIENVPNLRPADRSFLDIIRNQALQGAGVALGGRPDFFPSVFESSQFAPAQVDPNAGYTPGPDSEDTGRTATPKVDSRSTVNPEGTDALGSPVAPISPFSPVGADPSTPFSSTAQQAPASGFTGSKLEGGQRRFFVRGQEVDEATFNNRDPFEGAGLDAVQARQQMEQQMGLPYGSLTIAGDPQTGQIGRTDPNTGEFIPLDTQPHLQGGGGPLPGQPPADDPTLRPGSGNSGGPLAPIDPTSGVGGPTSGGGGTQPPGGGGGGGTQPPGGGGGAPTPGGSFFTGPLQQTPGQMAAPFMNPFISNVIDPLRGEYDRQRQQATVGTNQAATAAGAFGGSRQGVAEGTRLAELDRQQAKDVANLQMQGFQNALQMGIPFAERQRALRQQQLQEPLFRQGQALSMLTGALGPVGTGNTQTYQPANNTGAGVAGGALAGAGVGSTFGPWGAGIGALGGGLLGLL